MVTVYEAAAKYVKLGYSFVPCGSNKRPKDNPDGYGQFKWEVYATRLPSLQEAKGMITGATGIGLIGGAVSGNLETIDFEDYKASVFDEWCGLVREYGLAEVLEKCYIERSVRGGYHVVFRCEKPVPRTEKLCHRMAKDDDGSEKILCVIETRGEGHYACVYPTPGYEPIQGSLENLPVITAEQHDTFHALARSMTQEFSSTQRVHDASNGHGVGGDFNKRATWEEILSADGWAIGNCRNGITDVTRPGKNPRDGISGRFGLGGTDLLYVFSTNVPGLEPKLYSKFGYWTFTRHYGNFTESVKDLAARGYKGEERDRPQKQNKPDNKTAVPSGEDRGAQRWVTLDTVESKKTEWLIEPYIPLGEVTLVAGDPGEGKSSLLQAISAAVSRGAELFGKKVPQGQVVFLSAEQSLSRVTKPRFEQMGADLTQIICPDDESGEEIKPFVLDMAGMGELREQVVGSNVKLIVVDTVTAYIEGQRDFNTANSVREWMRRLADIARAQQCALVILAHCNKNTNAKPLYRIQGSIDFVGASRSVLMVGHDPDDDNQKAFTHEKSNVGPKAGAIGFVIDAGEFRWTGPCDMTGDRMFEPAVSKEASRQKKACADWLAELLKDGPMNSDDIHKAAKENGFSRNATFDAKKLIGAKAERDKFGEDGKWCWYLPSKEDSKPSWWAK